MDERGAPTPMEDKAHGLLKRDQRTREIHWLGPPCRMEEDKVHYRGAEVEGLQLSLGDYIFLQPAETGVPLYIGLVLDLFQQQQQQEPEHEHLLHERSMQVTVSWFYRPQELEIDSELPVYENEIFAADEQATHPLESVAGKCMVVSPSQSQSHSQSSVPVYVCSRKYIPSEGRVVLLEGTEELQDDNIRPFVLIQGNLVPMYQHVNPPPINRVITAPQSTQPTHMKASSKKASKRKRFSGQETNFLRPAGSPGSAPGSATTSMGGAQATSAEPSSQQGPGMMAPVVSTPRSRRPVGGHGRWSEERYEGAKAALIHILRMMDATRADKAVLRPALREQARKVIGDTGLLDHLLKHLADQVIAQDGERLRRRHNREGHMEYWLQSPAAAQAEEEMLKEEMQALTSELRQVREARHVLQAVRTEAAQAIQAVTGLKHHPEEALPNLQTPSLVPTSPHVNTRLSALEAADVEFKVRLHDAESFTVSAIEEVRREVASAGVLLGEHIGKFAQVTQDLEARCTALEKDQASMKEEVAGRFEALASALSQAVTATTMLGQELVRRDNVMMALQHEMASLKNSIYALQQGHGNPSQQYQSQHERPSSPLLRHGNGGPGNPVPSDLEAALKLPVPGQALEPSTIQDMTVAGVEAGGVSPSLELPHMK